MCKPTDEEVDAKCKEIGLESYTRNCYMSTYSPVSLNRAINEDDDSSMELEDIISSDNNVESEVIELCIYRGLRNEIERTLTEKERFVIIRRFYHGETLECVGKKMGLTRERVRQLENKAIRKLRHPAATKRILSTGVYISDRKKA